MAGLAGLNQLMASDFSSTPNALTSNVDRTQPPGTTRPTFGPYQPRASTGATEPTVSAGRLDTAEKVLDRYTKLKDALKDTSNNEGKAILHADLSLVFWVCSMNPSLGTLLPKEAFDSVGPKISPAVHKPASIAQWYQEVEQGLNAQSGVGGDQELLLVLGLQRARIFNLVRKDPSLGSDLPQPVRAAIFK